MERTLVQQRVELARAKRNPTVICRVASGWVVMSDNQFLAGYSFLLPDPVVPTLNTMDKDAREQFLNDMVLVGDALLEVTDAYRINYEILGNTDPALHAHIIPRYMSEPEDYRKQPVWVYKKDLFNARKFDPAKDGELMKLIARAIQSKL